MHVLAGAGMQPAPAVSPYTCTSMWTVIRTHVDTQLAPCMCTDVRSVTRARAGGAQARVDALRKTVAHQEQLLRTLKGQLALKEAHQKSLLLAQAQQQLDERRGGQQQKAASLASDAAERHRKAAQKQEIERGAAVSRQQALLRHTGADPAAVLALFPHGLHRALVCPHYVRIYNIYAYIYR